MKYLKALVIVAGLSICLGIVSANQDADNTKQNKPTDNHGTMTADHSSNGKSDVKLTAEIRRALMSDKSLSMSAHNAKIVVKGGKVTLKGVVKSDEEKQAVEQKATTVAGAGNVTNQLMVKGSKS